MAKGPLSCALRHSVDGTKVRLAAVVIAGMALEGNYELSVVAQGGAGVARAASAGLASFAAPGERIVAVHTFDVSRGQRLDATLNFTAAGVEPVRCTVKIDGGRAI